MTRPGERERCCDSREQLWLLEDIITAGVYGGMIPTAALDQLPPHRALLFTRIALDGAGSLERGDLQLLVEAAGRAVGNPALSAPGWWTRHLNANTWAPLPQRRNTAPAAARL